MANVTRSEGSESRAGQVVSQSYSGSVYTPTAINNKGDYHNIDLLVWIAIPIIWIIAGSIALSIGESKRNEVKRIKLVFLPWFLALVVPPAIIQLLLILGVPIGLSLTSSYILTITTKLFVLLATLWAGSKLHYKPIWSILLSLLTLAPFGPWLVLILLFTIKAYEGKYCDTCRRSFSNDKDFCEICGKELTSNKKMCSKCKHSFSPDKNNCPTCGTKLTSGNEAGKNEK